MRRTAGSLHKKSGDVTYKSCPRTDVVILSALTIKGRESPPKGLSARSPEVQRELSVLWALLLS
jgi:hypothetical protein